MATSKARGATGGRSRLRTSRAAKRIATDAAPGAGTAKKRKFGSKPIAGRVKKADSGNFVLVYHGFETPDPAKVAGVKKMLAPANVEEVLPGTLRVTGDSSSIRRSAEELASWSLSPEGLMTDVSPARGRFVNA